MSVSLAIGPKRPEADDPVAALLAVINLVDDNIVLFLAVGGNVERGEPGFAAVLGPGEEVENLLFLAHDALLLFAAVGDALSTKNTLPVFCADLDVVLDGSGVFELRFLGDADKLLDVVPLAAEQRAIIRNGIVCAIDGRNTADDSELAALRLLGEFVLQISPRRSLVEQVDFLNIGASGYWFAPVGVKDFGNATVLVSRGEATVAGFLSQQTDDARTVLIENKHRYGEAKVLKVLTDAEKVSGEVVVKKEVLDIILDLCGGFGGAILQPRTIAYLGVETLAGCQSFVFLDEREQVERHLIVAAPRNVRERIIYDGQHDVNVLAEHGGRVDGKRSAGLEARKRFNGVEIKKVHNFEIVAQSYGPLCGC